MADTSKPSEPPVKLTPPAPKKRRKVRHVLLALSFVLFVVAPVVASAVYLYTFATDQYHSKTAFSVRSEEMSSPLDVIGAFTQTGSNSAPDSEIIYDFIRSQPLIEDIDKELDLRSIYNIPERDPVFALGDDRSIEQLVAYWDRMVTVEIDSNSGVLEIETRAFTAEDAQRIAETIIAKSADLVEDLSRIAREDSMRFTVQDVVKAEERLKENRIRIREFRSEYQIIDPEADVESQVGIIAALQSKLADSLIDLEVIQSYSVEDDPRLPNIRRRVDAIRNQIADERAAVSNQSLNGKSLSEVIGEYEELLVDLEFSQNAYTAALAAEEQARIEANRRSRYLAVHVPPTRAQDSLYPDRFLLIVVIFACAFAFWGVLVMIYYNVRDRR
ncbi:sugar transporter [Pseudoruegeria sp. HB172150]|uniref:sugar transporter n=1 Tax=Pseudoruegeria sp. HB172150 TaxID=2721164 RepID=UPI001551AFA6|nr:sugar transporter [Pseudoruegeria sp. HB172150]